MKKATAIVLAAALGLSMVSGCGKQPGANVVPAGYQTVYPEKISGNLHNPGNGWVALEEPFYTGLADLGGTGDIPMVDNIGIQTSWFLIEREEGVFDWDPIDDVFDYWTGKNKRFNLRITVDCTFVPDTYQACPQWLIDKYQIPTKRYEAHGQNPLGYYDAVDVSNEHYLVYLDKFLAALNDYIADKPAVESIDLLGYGIWGEWHSGFDYGTYERRHDVLANVIDHWVEAFDLSGRFLSLCSAWEYRTGNLSPEVSIYQNPAYEDYVYWSSFDYGMRQEGVGFRRNGGAGVLMYNYDERLHSDYIRSGKRQPLMAEYFSNIDEQLTPNPSFTPMEGINDILFKLRPNGSTVVGWANVNVQDAYDKGAGYIYARGNEKFGYRLAVDKATFPQALKAGGKFQLMTQFSNSGVGRYWFDCPLKVSLRQDGEEKFSFVNSDINLKGILNGETVNLYTTFDLPGSLAQGSYEVAVSLVDPTTEKPAIALGNGGEDGDRVYVLGSVTVDGTSVPVGSLATKLSYGALKNFALKANTTYELSFAYTPGMALEDFQFGNYDGYVVCAESEKGGPEATVGYQKWQDVSGETTNKTVRFTTKNYDDYRVSFASDNYGSLTVGDVWLSEVSGAYDGFESGKIEGDWRGNDYAYFDASAIDGSYAVMVESDEKGNAYGLSSRNLAAGVHTLTFDSKATVNTGNGGYFFLNKGTSEEASKPVFEWYERPDSERKQFTVTFIAEEGERLWFGVCNRGAYLVDNLILTREAEGAVLVGSDLPEEPNVLPEVAGGFGVTEGFESGSFARSSMTRGTNRWGTMTKDPAEVITGDCSFKGQVEYSVAGSSWEWIPFLFSSPKYTAMQTGSAYRLTFRYKVLSRYDGVGADGQSPFFYVLARPNQLGMEYQCDQGLYKFGANDPIGRVCEASVDFYFDVVPYLYQGVTVDGVFDDYIFQFGMYLYSEIIIDDVKIEALSDRPAYEMGSVMDFEKGGLVGSGFYQHLETAYGELVRDGIAGASLKIANTHWGGQVGDAYEWANNVSTIPSAVVFAKHASYRVTFDYRVLEATPPGSVGFQIFAQGRGDYAADRVLGVQRFGAGETAGSGGKVTFTFTTKEREDYVLIFGLQRTGACLIDNVRIEALP